MTEFVLNMTGFNANMTRFVPNMTRPVTDMSLFVLNVNVFSPKYYLVDIAIWNKVVTVRVCYQQG